MRTSTALHKQVNVHSHTDLEVVHPALWKREGSGFETNLEVVNDYMYRQVIDLMLIRKRRPYQDADPQRMR